MTLYRRNRAKILIANAVVTVALSGAHDTIIAAQSGMAIAVTQLIATNQLNQITAIRLYDGNTAITPLIALGASGTLILDEVGGEQLELSVGSGLFGSNNFAGNTQVTAYYMLHDERTPRKKSTARATSFSAVSVGNNNITRTPNRFGNQ